MQPVIHRLRQKLIDRTALLAACRDDCPDPFQPAAAPVAPASLRHLSIDDHKTDRLLRKVVRRFRNRSRSGAITYAAAAVIAGDGGSREGAG